MSEYTPKVTGTGTKAAVQRFGGYLAGMVMPNIGAFIAWGLITALFIDVGWWPVAQLGGFDGHTGLVGPMITYPAPCSSATWAGAGCTARAASSARSRPSASSSAPRHPDVPRGHDHRPAHRVAAQKFDEAIEGASPRASDAIDNFSSGILGAAMAVGGYSIGPVMHAHAVGRVGRRLPRRLAAPAARSIVVEPGKVLFLNNAINHGCSPRSARRSRPTRANRRS